MKLSLLLCAAALLIGCNEQNHGNANQGGTGDMSDQNQSGSQGSRTPGESVGTNQTGTAGADDAPPQGAGTGTGARGTTTGGASAGPTTP